MAPIIVLVAFLVAAIIALILAYIQMQKKEEELNGAKERSNVLLKENSLLQGKHEKFAKEKIEELTIL